MVASFAGVSWPLMPLREPSARMIKVRGSSPPQSGSISS